MQLRYSRQTGVTLVELLIGMLVGLIVVAGGISVYTSSVKAQSDNIKLNRLNQDLRSMMDIMVRDIRRAGFVTDNPAANWVSLKNNPFFYAQPGQPAALTTDITIHDSGACILYAYNANNGDPPVVQSEERFGFRLNAGKELQMRKSGATNQNCGNENGNSVNDWETITEPEVEITGLAFTLTSTELNATSMSQDKDGDGCYDGDDEEPTTSSVTCKSGDYGNGLCDNGEACNICTRDSVAPDPACLYVRHVTIRLSGRLRDDPAMAQTLVQQVRIRNDKFVAAIP